MKLKISRAFLVAIVFATVSIFSVVYAAVEAVNYSQYWNARGELSSTVSSIRFQTNLTNGNVTIQATVSATNPTSYSGMIIRYFELRMWFTKPSSNQTLFAGDSNGEIIDLVTTDNQPIGDPVGPQSTVTATLSVLLSSSRSAAFSSFVRPDPSQVYGQTDVRAVVDSFLDPVVGPEVVQSYHTVQLT